MTRPLFARTSKNREFVIRRETSGPFLGLIVRIRSASLLPRSDSRERCELLVTMEQARVLRRSPTGLFPRQTVYGAQG